MRTLCTVSALLCLLALPVKGQVAVHLAPVPAQQFLSSTGLPLSGGCVFSYISGTSTPQATYADSTGLIQNANPLILDSGGFGSIWLNDAQTYRITVKSAGGVNCASGSQQRQIDGVSNGSLAAILGTNNTWTGNQTYNGNVTYNGSVTFATLTVGGAETVNGALSATAGGSLNGTWTFGGNNALTGNNTAANLNTIRYVDGVKYALTNAGVTQAIADANAQGGGQVVISQPVSAAATITLLSKVHVLCTGWETAPVTWTGGNGPAQVFSGNAITDWSVRGCRIVGPNVTLAGTADIRGIECDGCSRGFAENNKVTGMSYGIAELNSCGVDEHFNRNFVQTSTVQGIVTCGSHVSVESNRIDSVGTTALHHGIYNSGGIDVLDQGNQISNVQGFCIQAFEGTVGISIEEVRMIGNGCQLGGQAASGTRGGYFAGIASPATICRKITITGNTVENIAGDRGIGITDCTDVTIAGNPERTLNNSDCIAFSSTAGISKFTITPACDNSGLNGIDFFNTTSLISDGSITGGYIDTSVSTGVNLGNAHDVTVSGVRIRNFNTNNSSNPGISSNGINNVLSGNSISNSVGTGDGIDVLGSASDNVVYGNKIFGVGGTPLSDSGTRTLKYCNKTNNTDAVCQFPLSISIGGGTALTTTNQIGTGNLVLATSPTITTPTLSGVTNGTGLQLFNTTTTCTTGASVGAICTTAAITLPVAEADTSYRIVCTGKGLTNVPVVIATTNSSATQFTITIAALTAAAASFASYDCTAGHN